MPVDDSTPNDPRAIQRREICYSGRVQGVGFRYTTRAIAARMPVLGYVQNLSDERVRLVVEGPAEVIDRLLAAIAAKMERYIEHTEVRTAAPTGEFTSFEIRR